MGKTYRKFQSKKKSYFDEGLKTLVSVDWIEPLEDEVEIILSPRVQNVKPLKYSRYMSDDKLQRLEQFLLTNWNDMSLKKFMAELTKDEHPQPFGFSLEQMGRLETFMNETRWTDDSLSAFIQKLKEENQ